MSQAGPNLGIAYLWTERESGWGEDMNANLFMLDALLQLAVLDKDLTSPPGASHGARYIVGDSATGAWSGHDREIAVYRNDAEVSATWIFFDPKNGWLAWVEDEDALYVFDSGAWATI